MTADEIRAGKNRAIDNSDNFINALRYGVLVEIAAQLAELNALLKSVADAVLPLEK